MLKAQFRDAHARFATSSAIIRRQYDVSLSDDPVWPSADVRALVCGEESRLHAAIWLPVWYALADALAAAWGADPDAVRSAAHPGLRADAGRWRKALAAIGAAAGLGTPSKLQAPDDLDDGDLVAWVAART